MRKTRRLHLWIGLLTSFLILIEAVTGLLMVEPWLIGVSRPSMGQRIELQKTETGEVETKDFVRERIEAGHFHRADQGNSIMGFVKNLHAGRIGNTDVSFLLDIIAIGLIILTVTGIILSIKALKVQHIKRKY
jgi:hypothetical protein